MTVHEEGSQQTACAADFFKPTSPLVHLFVSRVVASIK